MDDFLAAVNQHRQNGAQNGPADEKVPIASFIFYFFPVPRGSLFTWAHLDIDLIFNLLLGITISALEQPPLARLFRRGPFLGKIHSILVNVLYC